MMKRWAAMLMACMLLLTGCGGKGAGSSSQPTKAPGGQTTVSESKELAAFRGEIDHSGAQIAVAYLGYVELTSYEDLTVYLEANGFYELYPFLSDLTKDQFVQQEGSDTYVVVPVSKDTSLTVCDCYVDETEYVLAKGDEILKLESGQPVILQGNISEICPNLWVTAEISGQEPLEYAPSLSMEDGTVVQAAGVYDFSNYEHIYQKWQEGGEESSTLWGTWYTQAADGDGLTRAMKLSLWYDGSVEYSYGIPESEVLESFEGTWSEADGVLTLDLYGGPVSYDGSDMSEYAYNSVCSFRWDYQSRHLILKHIDGGVLLYGTEDEMFDFLSFDSYLLAGQWSAVAPVQDWTYDLSLLENGECHFAISEAGEELAHYEGWWFMSEDYYVSLDVALNSGQHPENPEMEYISGTYLAEKNGNTMDFAFDSGEILTLGMEEHGWETFVLAADSSCVSVHYAEDVAADWSEYDWVIVDDTVAVDAAFCTMVPVDDFTVVSLFLEDTGEDGSEMNFNVTELYEYGTLMPDYPLKVTLTIYGSLPSYGISFTDPNGIQRIFGVVQSGMDGSLELMEIQ